MTETKVDRSIMKDAATVDILQAWLNLNNEKLGTLQDMGHPEGVFKVKLSLGNGPEVVLPWSMVRAGCLHGCLRETVELSL